MASRSLVTVLVPVYNGQDHLRECLESIAAQTYSNWRALIVNNASSDGTRQIAEEYAQRDARFEVRNCEDFVSASENYNRALSFVPKDSEYVKFVEADNWLVPNCIELMVALANADSRIGFVGSYWLYGKRVLGSGISYR